MVAVNGYRSGNSIMLERDIDLSIGQQILVTIVDSALCPKKKVDLSGYMGRGKKLIEGDVIEAVRELRDNDRV